MARWKRKEPRNYDGHMIADDTAKAFSDFIGHERESIQNSLAKNIIGYVGQESPTPVHQFSQRRHNPEVTLCGQDWQAQGSASFAMLYSRVSESFRPVLDLGTFNPENGALSKARYQLGRYGVLRVVEYMPEAEDTQALATLLSVDPFDRQFDDRSEPLTDPIETGGLIVGAEELDALMTVLHTRTHPKSYNKVYEIPGTVKKSL